MLDSRRFRRRNALTPARRPGVETLEHRRLLSTIRVNTFEDLVDPPAGTVSLRSAIAHANRDGQADTIVVPAGTYNLLNNLRIVADKHVTIESEGGVATIHEVIGHTPSDIPVNNTVFTVAAGANATFVDLEITGGVANQRFTKMQGGGLINRGTAKLVECTIRDNSAKEGGGIDNEGTLTIQHSRISGNHANDAGGGVANFHVLNVQNSAIVGNASDLDAGGVFNVKTLTLSETQVQNNTCRRLGGGIWNLTGRSEIERNSRINGNTPNDVADTNGGTAEIGSGSIIGGPATR